MVQESFDDFDDVMTGAGDSLVASVVMLIAGIFSFVLISAMIRMVGGLGRVPVSGNTLVLSSSIITAAVIISSVVVAKK